MALRESNSNQPQHASPPVLQLEGVTKSFPGQDRPAVDDVNLSIESPSIVGLIGPDAAGKTTTLRLVATLLTPDHGSIRVTGIDRHEDPRSVQGKISYMPQQFGLYEDLTVRENLNLYSDLRSLPAQDRKQRYADLMEMAQLGEFTNRLAGDLSGGMKQKLGLACALVNPPDLLLLDEPTAGVDPISRRQLWKLIQALVSEAQVTVLVSTAYLDEARFCDRVMLMHHGSVLGYGPPGEFTDRVAGSVFLVRSPKLSPRALQMRLTDESDVRDAVMQADAVRILLRGDSADRLRHDNEAIGLEIEATEPRFEDAFIDLLHEQDRQIGGSRIQTKERSSGEQSQDNMIEVEEIKRKFGDFYAVKGLSFSVRPGEVFGLLGPNGAGKSTTFKMLCGLLPASEGRLRVAGVDMRHAPAQARARIGYMSQKFSLYGKLTVLQNLKFFSRIYGLQGKRLRDKLDWALHGFDLEAYREANSESLPIGYKQRLAMAAAVMHEPEVIFLDEPTSGVDPVARREFWQRINSFAQGGTTILVTTHFMEEAEYCDRLGIMHQGRLLATGNPGEIRRQNRTQEHPSPDIEQAFINLVEQQNEHSA